METELVAAIQPGAFKPVDTDLLERETPETVVPPEESTEPPVEVPEAKETPETPEVPETPAEPEVKEPPAQEPPKEYDWKEEIKKVDKTALLKEAGLDEFEIDFINFRKNGGDPIEYLNAKSVDYSKMTDQEIMRRNLQSQYSELDSEEFEMLLEDELSKYRLDDEDEQVAKLARIKLKTDANRVRQGFIENQKKFVIPVKEQVEDVDQQKHQEEAEAAQKKWVEDVKTNEASKELLQSKKLVLGDIKTPFNYSVENPAEMLEAATDANKFWALFNQEGKTDMGRFYKTYAYAKDPAKLEKALIAYGESLGRQAEIDGVKNPSKPGTGTTPAVTYKDDIEGIGAGFMKATGR